MDRDQPVSAELEADLDNLRKLNQYFGGYHVIRCFLRCWLKPGRPYRLLDLATGSGDIPRLIVDWARARKIPVRIDAVDRQGSTLEIARRRSEGYPEIDFIQADARTFGDQLTYDLVLCSLALHHFSDADAVRLLRRAAQLSHDKVLITDLDRNWFTWISVCLVTSLIFTDRMTKHDGRLSVKRSFSFRELDEIAERSGWRGFGHRRFFPARQALWINVEEEAPVMPMADPALDYAT